MGAVDVEVVGGKGMAGMGHHGTTAIRQGLDGDLLETPTLLGRRIEMQQAEGQLSPGLACGGIQHHQQVAAGLGADARNQGEGVVELEIGQSSSGLLEGHVVPAKNHATAGMGQQGAAEHQPLGLAQQLSIGSVKLPEAVLPVQKAHQGAVMGLEGLAGKAQQSLAEMVHAAQAPVEGAQTHGVGLTQPEAGFALKLGDHPWPGLNPAPREQGLEQVGIGFSGDVEQGGAVVDAQGWILAGATGAGPTTRAPPRFPEADRALVAQ